MKLKTASIDIERIGDSIKIVKFNNFATLEELKECIGRTAAEEYARSNPCSFSHTDKNTIRVSFWDKNFYLSEGEIIPRYIFTKLYEILQDTHNIFLPKVRKRTKNQVTTKETWKL